MVTNIKMQVTPDLSRRVQEIVFANGGSWQDGSIHVKHTDSPFLYIHESKCLTYCTTQEIYIASKIKEEIAAYDFIASQGEQKWLPKFGEEVEVSDDEHSWVKGTFVCYIPKKNHFPFYIHVRGCGKVCYKFCRPLKPTKTITIDGKDIEISPESYEALKKQLLKELI